MNRTADSYFHEALGRWIAPWEWEAPVDEEGRPTLDDITQRIWAWSELVDVCQSPIEQMMLAEVIFLNDGYGVISWDFMPDGPRSVDETETIFDCQALVLQYRADFLFTVRVKGNERKVVVECDGHDFHERTKEQAQRDKARDREMTAHGYTVLRFTGSEIYRNAANCVSEIEDLLCPIKTEMMRAVA